MVRIRARMRLTERRRPDSNRRIADLQSAALPLGYGAVTTPFMLKPVGSCVKVSVLSRQLQSPSPQPHLVLLHIGDTVA